MIIVYMFQIGIVLFEQDQQICITAYKMLRYLCVCLTQIKAVDIHMSIHPIAKYFLIASCWSHATSSKTKMKFGSASFGGNTSLLLENVK